MLTDVLLIVVSLILLYFGASWLVNGASALATRLGVTPLIIGLTVVAFGTSTPELIVSIQAALQGNGGISIGNVVGSNIFNIGVILGVSALCYPIKVKAEVLRLDVPVMLLTALLFFVFFLNYELSRLEGMVLLIGSIGYTLFNVRKARQANAEVQEEFQEAMPKTSRHWAIEVLFILLGLGVLIFGSDLLVNHAVSLAKRFQVSDVVIGLTIVAAGTSMPELATSVVAAIKKQSDIALGNVVGSNIYNILIILGVSTLITPIKAPDIALVDSLVMVGISVLLIPLVKTGFILKRWEGALLLGVYGAYLFYLLAV
ncbi:cation:H+ antiporter [Catalinimonas alkaloidigena]|uniref:calcium/sodium antiporter n=1 Tax=Catalinimonas alkaloidigena TaxID=1075417 RepID=UPI002405E820|nr:calcium/sodium antiporter [Catalinimonas alkaloidigena]MDF9799909.1 cation:H+ antiporter [Catalinimonas alkaloidigena]